MFQIFPQEIAWRALFFVGLLPALLIFYIRANVPEPKVFQQTATAAARRGTLDIFGPDLLATTILGATLVTGAQGAYYAITTFLPTLLRTQRHLTVMGTGGYLAVIIVGSWAGFMVSAYLNDAIGRRKNFFIYAIGSLIVALAYTQAEIPNSLMLVIGFPLGFLPPRCRSAPRSAFSRPAPMPSSSSPHCWRPRPAPESSWQTEKRFSLIDECVGPSTGRALWQRRRSLSSRLARCLACSGEGALQRGKVVGFGQHGEAVAHRVLRA